ncbi:MAG TPA: metalloregulator ArsR/SmtB family transcription factor [Alphaproteobacteria bacterium]|nr:metalloregulator ArsR/SmtB family transcription factor [Alphaproteobacteria bacterium]
MEALLQGLKAAAEPTRVRILALCAHGELSVSDLTQILGQSQPRVSRHLKLLCDAGLLDRFREGTYAFFRLAERGAGGELARTVVDLIPVDDAILTLDLERLAGIKDARARQAATYFNENAARWDEIRALHIADSEVERALVELLPKGGVDDLLDLGTGTGRMLAVMANHADKLVGIDLSREMLAVARANLERAGLRRWQVRQGDLYQLPLASASFDVAVMHQVLHYLEDPEDALVEAARVIRPEGVLVIADFAPHDVGSLREEHAHRWLGLGDAQVAGWLAAAGFACDAPIHLPGNPLTVTIWRAVRKPAAAISAAIPPRRTGDAP